VTDAEVDAKIEEERAKQGVEAEVEGRAVVEGDTVNLDYSGSVDGVAFAGGTAEGQTLKIGSHSFIPGFEEQMVGMNIGEEKDLQVTFPEQYHAEELAGKAAVFHVKVNSITETQLPALDDDFAKDISEFDTLDEYKADIRAKLEAQAAERDNNNFTNAVLDVVINNATVEIPEAMIERQVDSQVREFEYRLQSQGLKMEDFLKYTGADMAAFREQYRPQAIKAVKAHLVLEAIEKAENIDATEEQIDEIIAQFAPQTGKTVEELKAQLTEADREYFKADAIRDNCVKFLCDSAVAE
jgi:trigger factor